MEPLQPECDATEMEVGALGWCTLLVHLTNGIEYLVSPPQPVPDSLSQVSLEVSGIAPLQTSKQGLYDSFSDDTREEEREYARDVEYIKAQDAEEEYKKDIEFMVKKENLEETAEEEDECFKEKNMEEESDGVKEEQQDMFDMKQLPQVDVINCHVLCFKP